MSFDVHLRKRTNIANANHIDCEVSEEIHDVQRFVAQIETQKERGDYRTDQLLDHVFLQRCKILIQFSKVNEPDDSKAPVLGKVSLAHSEHYLS